MAATARWKKSLQEARNLTHAEVNMLITVVVVGFAVVAFQIGAQRILLVELVKQVRILNMMVEQIDGVDASYVGERAQMEIDIAANK